MPSVNSRQPCLFLAKNEWCIVVLVVYHHNRVNSQEKNECISKVLYYFKYIFVKKKILIF